MTSTPTAIAPLVSPIAPAPGPRILHTFAWWDRPTVFNSRPEFGYTLPATIANAPRCQLKDLALHADNGGAGGTVYGALRVHNVTKAACLLRGHPQYALIDRKGVVWQSSPRQPPRGTPAPSTVILVPNSWAISAPWGIGMSCGGYAVTNYLRVSIPGDSHHVTLPFAPGGGPASEGCLPPGAQAIRPLYGQLGNPAFAAIPVPDNGGGLLPGLRQQIHAPLSVRGGEVLHYTVVLSYYGPNSSSVGGTTCPLYEQRLDADPAAGGSFLLRCDSIVLLNRGQGVAYNMSLSVPLGARHGPATLSWRFLEPALPALSATVTVR